MSCTGSFNKSPIKWGIDMIRLTNRQARQFMLLKQGLLGEYRFIGKQGAYDYVRQMGCIQFDPVDVCGKNAELTLQSRVKGFSKKTLYELLYEDRLLIDFPDKNLSILPAKDWPYFERYREAARKCGEQFLELPELEKVAGQLRRPSRGREYPLAFRHSLERRMAGND